ncbi:TIGR01906 family membrane protein [Floccifex sp.]|uniref:TIGR01906 family membrane protein n=1 Tax=Floccifex sp. TaxID=2815810 RepID=UPI002A7590C0|nr:TIGR01906 family membrane protein [Floccifex sp.]MDD7281684.1 TIGR01906 family membrane protein [Erysipelotrichaceae bacterium]MDY2958968.1 TIGR01906 family membrane protein [Floccifex sp.]
MKSYLAYIFNWCLIICCVVFGIRAIALEPDFFVKRYDRYQFDKILDVSQDNLDDCITVLLDYIKDERDDIVVYIDGQEAFNEVEKKHMIDVKNLYQNAVKVALVCGVLAMGILIYFLAKEKRFMSFLTMGFIRVTGTIFVMLVFFGIWFVTDFTSLWNWLHTLLFSNQLWLLDPKTSFMIRMLPEVIFNQMVLAIALYLVICIEPLFVFSCYYQIKKAPIGFERK